MMTRTPASSHAYT